jgi:hypothetical protein
MLSSIFGVTAWLLYEKCLAFVKQWILKQQQSLKCLMEDGRIQNSTLERAEVVETIAGRIAIGFAGFRDAFGHHLPGGILVVRALFFFFFAIRTNRLVIVDRKDPAVFGFQRFAAPAAFFCA